MIFYIIFFIIAITVAFGMLIFRAWEIKTMRVNPELNKNATSPKISFRYIEKSFLYIVRRIIFIVILTCVKYWLIITTKIKKQISENWPKVHIFFQGKPKEITPRKHSFISQTILESRVRISKLKEKIKKEHE
jgi:hypothetical protein